MKIEDFTFATKQVRGNWFECLMCHRESKITYGIVIQGNGMPPNDWVFQQFLNNGKAFFIDVGGDIIPEPQPVGVVADTPTTGSIVESS